MDEQQTAEVVQHLMKASWGKNGIGEGKDRTMQKLLTWQQIYLQKAAEDYCPILIIDSSGIPITIAVVVAPILN